MKQRICSSISPLCCRVKGAWPLEWCSSDKSCQEQRPPGSPEEAGVCSLLVECALHSVSYGWPLELLSYKYSFDHKLKLFFLSLFIPILSPRQLGQRPAPLDTTEVALYCCHLRAKPSVRVSRLLSLAETSSEFSTSRSWVGCDPSGPLLKSSYQTQPWRPCHRDKLSADVGWGHFWSPSGSSDCDCKHSLQKEEEGPLALTLFSSLGFW